MPDQVKVLHHRPDGKIYALGDIHGMKDVLDMARERLRPNDQLVLVGDLTDRGPDNLAVIESILENNADPTKPKIHAILGNHEAMVLRSIEALEKILKELTSGRGGEDLDAAQFIKKANLNPQLLIHLNPANGGQWLLDLFVNELFVTQNIVPSPDQEVEYQPASKIKKIKDYFNSLTYVIRVVGNDELPAINFVHADMPVNEGTLKRIILKETEFDDEELFHALWARPNDFDPSIKRDELSTLTVCGHNIILYQGNLSVRVDCNTINCDIGTYMSKVGLLLDLTEGFAHVIGTVTPANWEAVASNLAQINRHLELQKKMYAFHHAPYKSCKTFKELQKAIAKAHPDLVERTLLYLFNNDALTKFGIHTMVDLKKANMDAYEAEHPLHKRSLFETASKSPKTADLDTSKKPKKS